MHCLGAWAEESKYLIPSILSFLYSIISIKKSCNSLNISSSESTSKKTIPTSLSTLRMLNNFTVIQWVTVMYIDQKYFDSWMQRFLSQFELIYKKLERLDKKDIVINDETLLDNQDLCLLLKVSKRTLQRFRSLGKLPYKRIGKKTYYLESDVHKFIQNGFKSFVD